MQHEISPKGTYLEVLKGILSRIKADLNFEPQKYFSLKKPKHNILFSTPLEVRQYFIKFLNKLYHSRVDVNGDKVRHLKSTNRLKRGLKGVLFLLITVDQNPSLTSKQRLKHYQMKNLLGQMEKFEQLNRIYYKQTQICSKDKYQIERELSLIKTVIFKPNVIRCNQMCAIAEIFKEEFTELVEEMISYLFRLFHENFIDQANVAHFLELQYVKGKLLNSFQTLQ